MSSHNHSIAESQAGQHISFTFSGTINTFEAAALCIKNSLAFQVTPLPFDQFELMVKSDGARALLPMVQDTVEWKSAIRGTGRVKNIPEIPTEFYEFARRALVAGKAPLGKLTCSAEEYTAWVVKLIVAWKKANPNVPAVFFEGMSCILRANGPETDGMPKMFVCE